MPLLPQSSPTGNSSSHHTTLSRDDDDEADEFVDALEHQDDHDEDSNSNDGAGTFWEHNREANGDGHSMGNHAVSGCLSPSCGGKQQRAKGTNDSRDPFLVIPHSNDHLHDGVRRERGNTDTDTDTNKKDETLRKTDNFRRDDTSEDTEKSGLNNNIGNSDEDKGFVSGLLLRQSSHSHTVNVTPFSSNQPILTVDNNSSGNVSTTGSFDDDPHSMPQSRTSSPGPNENGTAGDIPTKATRSNEPEVQTNSSFNNIIDGKEISKLKQGDSDEEDSALRKDDKSFTDDQVESIDTSVSKHTGNYGEDNEQSSESPSDIAKKNIYDNNGSGEPSLSPVPYAEAIANVKENTIREIENCRQPNLQARRLSPARSVLGNVDTDNKISEDFYHGRSEAHLTIISNEVSADQLFHQNSGERGVIVAAPDEVNFDDSLHLEKPPAHSVFNHVSTDIVGFVNDDDGEDLFSHLLNSTQSSELSIESPTQKIPQSYSPPFHSKNRQPSTPFNNDYDDEEEELISHLAPSTQSPAASIAFSATNTFQRVAPLHYSMNAQSPVALEDNEDKVDLASQLLRSAQSLDAFVEPSPHKIVQSDSPSLFSTNKQPPSPPRSPFLSLLPSPLPTRHTISAPTTPNAQPIPLRTRSSTQIRSPVPSGIITPIASVSMSQYQSLHSQLLSQRRYYEAQTNLRNEEHGKEIDDILEQLTYVESEYECKLQSLHDQLKKKSVMIEALGTQLTECRKEHTAAIDKAVLEKKQRAQELEEKLRVADGAVRELQSILVSTKAEYEKALQIEVEKRKTAIKTVDRDIRLEAQRQFAEANKLYITLKHEYDAVVKNRDCLQNEVNALKRERAVEGERQNSQTMSLHSQISDLHNQLSQLRSNVGKMTKDHKAELQASRDRGVTLEGRWQDALAECKATKSALKALSEEKDKLVGENVELQNVCEELMALVEGKKQL